MKYFILPPDFFPFHDVQMIQCGQSDCEPGYSFGPYVRDFYLLHLVTDGEGIFRIAGNDYCVKQGEMFFIPPGLLTFYQADAHFPWSYMWIGFRGAALPKLFHETGLSKDSPVIPYPDSLPGALTKVLSHADSDGLDSFRTMGYVYLFISELLNIKKESDSHAAGQRSYIDAAVRFMEQHVYDRISISSIADMLGISRNYFCTIFKQSMGMPPQQYLMELKMEKAKIFLETTNVDIKYIADSLGYEDLFTFSHSFKRITGVSPKEWRTLRSKKA